MLGNFNAQEYDISKAWSGGGTPALPPGTYNLVLGAAEVKTNRNQNGSYLELPGTVADGPMAGQQFTFRLNLENPSAQTVEIAKKQLASICMALGVAVLQSPQQLYGGRITVDLATQETPRNDGNGTWTNNQCVGVWPLGRRPADIPPPIARPAAASNGPAPAQNTGAAPQWPAAAAPAQVPAAAAAPAFAPAPTGGGWPAPAPSTHPASVTPNGPPSAAPAAPWGNPSPGQPPAGVAANPAAGPAPWGNGAATPAALPPQAPWATQ